jgi:hypothetical protein
VIEKKGAVKGTGRLTKRQRLEVGVSRSEEEPEEHCGVSRQRLRHYDAQVLKWSTTLQTPFTFRISIKYPPLHKSVTRKQRYSTYKIASVLLKLSPG